jgi:hypothetical protein
MKFLLLLLVVCGVVYFFMNPQPALNIAHGQFFATPTPVSSPPPSAAEVERIKEAEKIIQFYQQDLDDLIARKKGGSPDAAILRQKISAAKKTIGQ